MSFLERDRDRELFDLPLNEGRALTKKHQHLSRCMSLKPRPRLTAVNSEYAISDEPAYLMTTGLWT